MFALTGYSAAEGLSTTGFGLLRDAGIEGWAYITLSLFVVSGLELGLPLYAEHLHGPYIAMWVAFFLAPLITTSVAAEAVIRLFRSTGHAKIDLNDHLILLGDGDYLKAYAQAVHKSDPNKQILIAHHDEAHAIGSEMDYSHADENFVRLRADFRNVEKMSRLSIHSASEAVLIDNDDQVNLELAWQFRAIRPALNTAAHVADLGLLRRVTPIVRHSRLEAQNHAPALFSVHRIASMQLYDLLLAPHFEQTLGRDCVVILGFGRFAQTVLELLAVNAVKELDQCLLVAPDATIALRKFSADVALDDIDVNCLDGDLEDPETWHRLGQAMPSGQGSITLLLATDNTLLNFRVATLARATYADAKIFLRCFKNSGFSATLANEMGVDLVCFEEIIGEALQDHFEALSAM